MTDHTQLRKLATEALLDHEIRHSFTIDHSGWSGASDLIEAQEFIAAANPKAVLELLDENERLRKDAERYRWLKRNSGVSQGRMRPELKLISICPTYGDERDVDNLDSAIDAAMKLNF